MSSKSVVSWLTKEIFSLRDLIVVYLIDAGGKYTLDPVLKTFVNIEDGK